MDFIECADCGQIVTDEAAPCPRCGSMRKNILLDVLSRLPPGESISLWIRHRHQLWKYFPKAVQAILNGLPSELDEETVKGLCLSAMITTTSLVEGIITDHLVEELESMLYIEQTRDEFREKIKGLNFTPWSKKKKMAEEFGWFLSTFDGYDMVETLFMIRGNMGHGKSYDVEDSRIFRGQVFKQEEPVTITNDNYKTVYMKLAAEGIVPPIDKYPHVAAELLLTAAVARRFYDNALVFLRSFFKNVRLKIGYNMEPEFESSLRIKSKA